MFRYITVLILISQLIADYGGGYAGAAFRYSANSRDISLAGATVAGSSSGFIPFSNPAGLVAINRWQGASSFLQLPLDRSVQTLSISRHLPPKAGIAISFFRAGTENIQGRDLMNQATGIFGVSDMYGMLSFGLAPTDIISLGLNIKAQFSTITLIENTHQGNGISFDLGIHMKPANRFAVAAKIENVSGDINWKLSLGDEQRSYLELFPKTLSLGVAYNYPEFFNLYFQEDFVMPPEKDVIYRSRFGAEATFNLIEIRVGVLQKRGQSINEEIPSNNWALTAGLGFVLKNSIQIDYGADLGRAGEGFGHMFSFIYDLK